MLFRSRVCVVSQYSRAHQYAATREEATWLVHAGLAVPDEPVRPWLGIEAVELTRSLDEIKAIAHHREKPKHRPRLPLRAPDSSTGDAGRGCAYLPPYATVHLRPARFS